MKGTGPKKTATTAAAEKGFYIVTPERKGAGPPKKGKYTEARIWQTKKIGVPLFLLRIQKKASHKKLGTAPM